MFLDPLWQNLHSLTSEASPLEGGDASSFIFPDMVPSEANPKHMLYLNVYISYCTASLWEQNPSVVDIKVGVNECILWGVVWCQGSPAGLAAGPTASVS